MGQMRDEDANLGATLGIALGMPALAVVGVGMYWMALGDMPAFQHAPILALAFGGMMGMYLGGLLGMMYVYERAKDAPPPAVPAKRDEAEDVKLAS